jgi:hypothetical protein
MADPARFHKLYGVRRSRITFQKKDFLDYTLMTLLTAGVLCLCYGPRSAMALAGCALCAWMIIVFPLRHGVAIRMPVILRRPQDIVYMLIYKLQNLQAVYFVAIAVLLLENYLIHLTPQWPHHVELMRRIGLWLFYGHFLGILVYRTAILVAYLARSDHVRQVLLQTSWRSLLARQPNVALHILHAYVTGVLTHMVLIAPWYVALHLFDFSVIFLPVVAALNIVTQLEYLRVHNAWFYRDHWLGHNTEFEFIYLHGTHHDAIPCGLIGVGGNGHLEGFLRHILAFPTQCFEPCVACFFFSFLVIQDIAAHQYIPGVYPRLPREFHEVAQHSVHHFGRLEPYSFGLNFDQPHVPPQERAGTALFPQELKNSTELDEQLTGFQWDNPSYRRYLALFDRYQGTGRITGASGG